MVAYADASFIVALYLQQSSSAAARAAMLSLSPPLPFTHLHALEVRNAIRRAVFRGEITVAERDAVLQTMASDLQNGVLAQVAVRWADVWHEADRLSAGHTETMGCRSLDILHVAIARTLNAPEFLSFDANQRQLAAAEGLTVKP